MKPTRFRFPIIGRDELKFMRRVKDVVRRGRVSSIRRGGGGSGNGDGDVITVGFGPGEEDWKLPVSQSSDGDHVFVHCTSPGPFNDIGTDELFHSDREMSLGLLVVPPISISMSILAKLESARMKGKLDLAFGRELLKESSINVNSGDSYSENDILQYVIRGLTLKSPGKGGEDVMEQVRTIVTLGAFLAVLDPDPMVGYNWLSSNRLSFFSIPNFKSHLVEDLCELVAKGEKLGYPSEEVKMIRRMVEKLEPLRGK